MFQVRTLSGSLPCRLIVAVQDAAMNRGTVPGDKRNGATRFAQTCNLYIIHLSLNCHAGADMLAEVPRMARLFRRADVRFGSRLCENALEPRTLRIVFSIALCKQQLPVRLIPAATKSRWKFYTQVQRLSFHTAWVKNRQRTGAHRCPLCRQERTFLRTAALRQKRPVAQEYAHLPIRIVIEGTAMVCGRDDRPACGIFAPEYFEQAFPSEERASNRSWQIFPLRTFRWRWRAECSARSTVPSFSGHQRSARCPNVRLPCRRRPSCRCRRRRFPYLPGRR